MINYCTKNLLDIRLLLSLITDKDYQYQSKLLSGASIGQHIRHILEFYTCLLQSLKTGTVNYDSRPRDLELENHVKAGIKTIDNITRSLADFQNDIQLMLEGNYSHQAGETICINTTLYRELAYCLEHSTHHQALIKIGLKELNLSDLMNRQFGIAPATVRFQQEKFATINGR